MSPTSLAILTVAIAFVSLILSIFASAWLNLPQMSEQIELLGQCSNAKIETATRAWAGLSDGSTGSSSLAYRGNE